MFLFYSSAPVKYFEHDSIRGKLRRILIRNSTARKCTFTKNAKSVLNIEDLTLWQIAFCSDIRPEFFISPSNCNFPESRKKKILKLFSLFYPKTLNIICFVEIINIYFEVLFVYF